MIIQEQTWYDFTRIILMSGCGSVQVELYAEEQEWGGTAFLYALWVGKSWRRQGIAKDLMAQAEREVKRRGHKSITLEWKLQDTPREILDWYERLGYEQKEFGDGYSLMRKKL